MKTIKDIFLGIIYIAVCLFFVATSAIVAICDFTGKHSLNLYNRYPALTIAALTCVAGYSIIGFIATTWSW